MRLRVSVSVYVSAQGVVQSVTQLYLVESNVGFSVRGAVSCHASGKSPGRDPHCRKLRTLLAPPATLVQRRSRALRLYPSRFLGFASSGCVSPFSRVTRWQLQPAEPESTCNPAELIRLSK